MSKSQSKNQVLEPGVPMGRRKWTSEVKERADLPSFPPFCSIQAFSGLHDAHPHWCQ